MYNIKKNILKSNFFAFSLKKNLLSIIFFLYTVFLILFSTSNLSAAKAGLKLWANNVVPSLFPFLIATNLLSYTNVVNYFSKFFNKTMRYLFNVSGSFSYAFLLGFISGYPIGAKIVTELYKDGKCTKDEAERALCFTNNSGPLFIIGTIGIGFFKSSTIGLLLLISHFLASITSGIILGFISKFNRRKNDNNIYNRNNNFSTEKSKTKISNLDCTFSNVGEIISSSITNSIKTIFMIGGFIIIFSVVISICNSLHIFTALGYIFSPFCSTFNINLSYVKGFFEGLVELTNGIAFLSSIANKNITINLIFISFILGCGGISVLLQVLNIVSKEHLSVKFYIFGKILQGIFACFYTYILISNFAIFNFNL